MDTLGERRFNGWGLNIFFKKCEKLVRCVSRREATIVVRDRGCTAIASCVSQLFPGLLCSGVTQEDRQELSMYLQARTHTHQERERERDAQRQILRRTRPDR